MRLALVLLLLAGCATPRYSKTSTIDGHSFKGPQRVALSGGDDDKKNFERYLVTKGFRVAKGLTDLTPEEPAAYVLTIDGICGGWGIYGTLEIQCFDVQANAVVFTAKLNNGDDCPDTFFAEVADVLQKGWESRK